MTSTSASQATAIATGDDALAASFDHCRQVTRQRARNFYYGMMLTPGPKRAAMYAIYAWMRAADDLADTPGDFDAKCRQLETFRRDTRTVVRDAAGWLSTDRQPFAPMWPAVGKTLRDFNVPLKCLDDMIDGQLLDQRKTRYDTFDELYDYCYKVASTVGLVCVTVWGFDGGEATLKLAEQRGVALQLTNILRDLVEDARRDRIYLPRDELRRFGFDADTFGPWLIGHADPATASAPPPPSAAPGKSADATTDAFDKLMRFQTDRARSYYERSASLEHHVARSCRPTCWAMMRIYEGLLDRIARQPRRVLTRRVRLGRLTKLLIALRATLRRGLRT